MEEMRNASAGEKAPETAPETDLDLKAAREALGLSLNDIFLQTRVSLVNLSAVEDQDFGRLPPPVYARDYISKYARAIGINDLPLLARYEKHLERLNAPPKKMEIRKPWPGNGHRYSFLFTTLAAVIVVGLLVYALHLYDQAEKSLPVLAPTAESPFEEPSAPPEEPPATEIAQPAATMGKSATTFEAREPASSPVKPDITKPPPPPAQATSVAAKKNHLLVIEAREVTWIRITEDGTAQEVLLQPGERIERSAEESFLIDVGNAGGISVAYQGKPLPSLGKSGAVVRLRLPEKSREP
ncbi:MAG: DUF4115 domain-containing protein [Syntrophaceae bacterium]|nr:DUF4115 domain-containing protein [Syntrophaceae bacterium]